MYRISLLGHPSQKPKSHPWLLFLCVCVCVCAVNSDSTLFPVCTSSAFLFSGMISIAFCSHPVSLPSYSTPVHLPRYFFSVLHSICVWVLCVYAYMCIPELWVNGHMRAGSGGGRGWCWESSLTALLPYSWRWSHLVQTRAHLYSCLSSQLAQNVQSQPSQAGFQASHHAHPAFIWILGIWT